MSKHSPLLTALSIAAIGFTFPLVAAEPALGRLVPSDVALVAALNDVPALRRTFPETATGRAWSDPEIARFFAPLRAQPDIAEFIAKVKAETGYTPEELLEFVSGDVLLTVPSTSIALADGKPAMEVLLAIEVGDNESKLRRLIEEQNTRRAGTPEAFVTEDYNGALLYLQAATESSESQDDDMVWALHEGRWFIATDRALVTGALDALAAGGLATSLTSSTEYQEVLNRAGGDADLVLLLNWKVIYPAVIAAFEAARDPNTPPNMFGVEPVNIMKALGLDALESISLTSSSSGSTERLDSAFRFTEPRGLLALMAYRDGPVARPDWVPSSWFNVTSQNAALSDAYAELERMLDLISPMMAGMAQGQLKAFERQIGVELKRDLIGNMGTAILSGYADPVGSETEASTPYDELDQFVAISLADAAGFERAVEAIKTHFLPPGDASPLQKRDYLDRTLHTFTPSGGDTGFTYAIADGWLLIGTGTAGSVESALQLMHTPNPANSFWQRADVRDALVDVPVGAFSVQYAELAPLMASLAASAVKFQATQDEKKGRFVDPDAVPSRDKLGQFFKPMISYGTRDANGFYIHAESSAR